MTQGLPDVRSGLGRLGLVGTVHRVAVRLDESLTQVALGHLVVGVLQRPLQVRRLLEAALTEALLRVVVGLLALAELRLDVLVGAVSRRGHRVGRQRGQVGLRGRVVGVLGRPVLQASGLVFTSSPTCRFVAGTPLLQADLACSRVLRRQTRAKPDVGGTTDEEADEHSPQDSRYNQFFHWNLFLAALWPHCFSVNPPETLTTTSVPFGHIKGRIISPLCARTYSVNYVIKVQPPSQDSRNLYYSTYIDTHQDTAPFGS